LILTIAGLIIILWAGLRTPAIQTFLGQKIASKLSETFNTEISIDRVSYGFKRNIIIRGLFIADQKHDTLIYIGNIEGNLSKLNFNKRKFYLDNIELKEVTSHILQISDSTYNYSFLTDEMKSDKDGTFEWEIKLAYLNISKNNFTF